MPNGAMRFVFDKAARVMNAWVTPEVNADSIFKRCHVESIVFDQRTGQGTTGLHRQLKERCFMAMMTPNQFFRLIGDKIEKYKDDPFYTDWLTRGRSIASPYLSVDFGNAKGASLPAITGHEGRHRMGAILARYGDVAVPVALYPVGKTRLDHVTLNHVRNLRGPVIPKNGRPVSPTGIERAYFNGDKVEIRDLLVKQHLTAQLTR